MKKLSLLLASTVLLFVAKSQTNEFKVHENGLIYSEHTMGKLAHIVDSLNLKYKTCELNKVFYSKLQSIGHIVTLDSGNLKQARKQLKEGIEFKKFIELYPEAEVSFNNLIIHQQYENYRGRKVIEFSEIRLDDGFGVELVFDSKLANYSAGRISKWVYNYEEKSEYWGESLTAFYFPSGMTSTPLPEQYARMIGYADCLIDTTVTKMMDDPEEGWVDLPLNWNSLAPAEKEKLLDEMRNTRVIGYCSMDGRPREHAVNIAMLAAETTRWEVFLEAHLDIMNDRFDRMSDGSYAWAGRQTYLRELEELDINVLDLILGISFRVENPAQNHYHGNIWRVGRALAETGDKRSVESALSSAMGDAQLDDFNRVLAFYLFHSYVHYLIDESEKLAASEKLTHAIEKLPTYLQEKVSTE